MCFPAQQRAFFSTLVCDKNVCVCEIWCVTKRCDKEVCERWSWKMVCDKVVCERWCVSKRYVKDGVWQSCVWQICVWKMVLPRHFVTHIHIHIHTYVRTYIHTYVRAYIHTYIYVHAYYLFTYFHTQSFTTSFVFPSFPVPATTFEAQYWKKLTCGVIRSFNFCWSWDTSKFVLEPCPK